MIAHVPGYLCAADMATALNVTVAQVYRLASRHGWRTARRPGHREVYYSYADAAVHTDAPCRACLTRATVACEITVGR